MLATMMTRRSRGLPLVVLLAAASASGGKKEPPRLMKVSAADAKAKGLPAIGLGVDLAGTAMSGAVLPDSDTYLRLSGPPGGPLLFRVEPWREKDADASTLEKAMRARFSRPTDEPFVVGKAATVKIGGAARPALPFMTGQSMARTAWCAAVVPAGKEGSLLVLAGIGGNAPDCAVTLAHESIAALVRSFRLK